jgi:DtxR family transcriptional regulator, Mn-dependent transcriptional regulator
MTDAAKAVGDRSESVEEYLEALFKAGGERGEVSVKRLATDLGVARPSVSQMLTLLTGSSLLARAPPTPPHLTAQGRVEGARLVRRHRLSERFLADYLDLPWDAVHEEACRFEHVLSPEVEARLAEQLGNPRTCPHGQVIPAADGSVDQVATRPLSEIPPGGSAVVVLIADEDPDLLRYLASLGVLPDTRVSIEGVAPFGGPLLVRVGGAQYALGREVAARIYVAG